jgi:hypothetical protein
MYTHLDILVQMIKVDILNNIPAGYKILIKKDEKNYALEDWKSFNNKLTL